MPDTRYEMKLKSCKDLETIQNNSVGQPSRLSEHSWRRHLPHFQLSAGYYFITFSYKRNMKTVETPVLQPSQKDIVFNAIRFLDAELASYGKMRILTE